MASSRNKSSTKSKRPRNAPSKGARANRPLILRADRRYGAVGRVLSVFEAVDPNGVPDLNAPHTALCMLTADAALRALEAVGNRWAFIDALQDHVNQQALEAGDSSAELTSEAVDFLRGSRGISPGDIIHEALTNTLSDMDHWGPLWGGCMAHVGMIACWSFAGSNYDFELSVTEEAMAIAMRIAKRVGQAEVHKFIAWLDALGAPVARKAG